MQASRRHFLRTGAGLAAGGLSAHATPLALSLAGLGALAANPAHAAETAGYKALVCLYMAGGNDSHNWVVPTDSTGYAQYSSARRELAWAKTKLLPLSVSGQAAGRTFGLPLELQPLQALYEAGRCAVVANVGPLDRPVTKAEFTAGQGLPAKLFSHNDQQSAWQSLLPEGAESGWGGRMGDLLASANQYPVFTAMSPSGNAVFLSGTNITQFQLTQDGPILVNALGKTGLHGSATLVNSLRQVLQYQSTNPFQAEYVKVMQRSMATGSLLQQALASVSVPALPTTPITLPTGASLNLSQDTLARQLSVVAKTIAAAPRLGMRRQVFLVQMGGFDTHANQMRDQPMLMAKVAQSASWFMSAMSNVGMQNNVTLFTASDFGRTLVSNGAGSDHGWGSHHFVMGGAVKGRSIHGRFPETTLGSIDDAGSGRLLPSMSVAELAASFGGWMGLNSSELNDVLPTLRNFNSVPALF